MRADIADGHPAGVETKDLVVQAGQPGLALGHERGLEAAVAVPRRFFHRLPGGEPFAFAGLWTTATAKDADEAITSMAIITTTANREVGVVHNRMPVILNGPDAEAAWLSEEVDLDAALELARPLP